MIFGHLGSANIQNSWSHWRITSYLLSIVRIENETKSMTFISFQTFRKIIPVQMNSNANFDLLFLRARTRGTCECKKNYTTFSMRNVENWPFDLVYSVNKSRWSICNDFALYDIQCIVQNCTFTILLLLKKWMFHGIGE